MTSTSSFVTAAMMLAIGFAGTASAAEATKANPAHPRSQASIQCSTEANAKNLHGKERVAFRRDCMRKASSHNAAYKAPATDSQPKHTTQHQKAY